MCHSSLMAPPSQKSEGHDSMATNIAIVASANLNGWTSGKASVATMAITWAVDTVPMTNTRSTSRARTAELCVA